MTHTETNLDFPTDGNGERTHSTAEATDAPPVSPSQTEPARAPAEPLFPKIIRFDSLARCGEEVWIENNGQIYRLRRTRQGKLILTK